MNFFDEPMDTSEIPIDSISGDGETSDSEDDQENLKFTRVNVSGGFSRKVSYEPDQDELVSELDVFSDNEAYQTSKDLTLPISVDNASESFKKQLFSLFRDLGIDKENERHYRFNTIHMRGVENMSTEDVYQYFASFAPSHVEWVDNASCNVIWSDDLSAAKVLLNCSKKIKNLDKVYLNEKSITKESDIENSCSEIEKSDNYMDAKDIALAIPSGHWRYGDPAKKSSSILLRYATRSDRKPLNAEKNSVQIRGYGNTEGLMSRSRSNKLKKFRHLIHKSSESKSDGEPMSIQSNDKPNPWVELAYEWGKTDKVERHHPALSKSIRTRVGTVKPNVPDLRLSLTNMKKKQKRLLGMKTNHNFKDSWETRAKIPRMKMYADEEEEKLEKAIGKSLHDDDIVFRPIEDLRNKINRLKNKGNLRQRFQKKQVVKSNYSESSRSENEYEDSDSGAWALEQYQNIRKSIGHNNKKLNSDKYDSESGSDFSENNDVSFKSSIRQRSPLQIEIDNDEYFHRQLNK